MPDTIDDTTDTSEDYSFPVVGEPRGEQPPEFSLPAVQWAPLLREQHRQQYEQAKQAALAAKQQQLQELQGRKAARNYAISQRSTQLQATGMSPIDANIQAVNEIGLDDPLDYQRVMTGLAAAKRATAAAKPTPTPMTIPASVNAIPFNGPDGKPLGYGYPDPKTGKVVPLHVPRTPSELPATPPTVEIDGQKYIVGRDASGEPKYQAVHRQPTEDDIRARELQRTIHSTSASPEQKLDALNERSKIMQRKAASVPNLPVPPIAPTALPKSTAQVANTPGPSDVDSESGVTVPPKAKKPLTKADAARFKSAAGGDRALAEKMARDEGYEF